MPEGAYNAGTIFLQVVPVFGDTMNAIKREARGLNKAIGDEAEAAGKEAGKRAGKAMGEEMSKEVKESGKKDGDAYAGEFQRQFKSALSKAHKEIEPIELKLMSNKARSELAALKRELKALGNTDVNMNITSKEAFDEALRLRGQIELIKQAARKIDVKVNFDEATRGLDGFLARVRKSNPELRVDTSTAERQMGAFETKAKRALSNAAKALGDNLNPEIAKIRNKLETLSNVRVGVGLDLDEAGFHAQMLALEGEIKAMPNVNVGVDLDLLAAEAELAALHKEINAVDRDDVNVQVDLKGAARVMAQLAAMRAGMKGAGGAAADSATSFRAFNIVILLVAATIPALIPLIAALGGALLALAPILAGVAAGAGVAILGFSGIGNAVKALADVQKNGAKDAQAHSKSMRSAARGVEDAERALQRARENAAQSAADAARSVADAERSAADSIRNALRQRADAERSLADAQRAATKAQQDLREARRLAQQDLEDAANNRSQNKLDERQGVIDLFNATVNNQKTQQDGSASNLEKEQASIQLEQARLRLKEIRQEQKRLGEEKKRTDRDGVNGTDRVIAAQEALNSAIRQQRDAVRALGDADRAVTQARVDGARQVQDAIRNQSRTAADNAQAIGDAQRNLTQAQVDYQSALKDTGDIGSASNQKLEDAMNKLGPAGQRFARYIFSLRKGFYAIRDAAQQAMLPGVQHAMETVINKYGPRFVGFVRRMGRAVGNSFEDAGKTFTNPAFEGFFKMINRLGPKFTRTFSKTTLNWMSVFARLMTIAAPWGEKLSDALLHVSENAMKFVNSKRGTDIIQDFLRYAFKVGPKVWKFLKDLWDAALNLGEALAPLGELVLGVFDAFLKLIGGMNSKVLGAIVTAIIALVVVFQILNGIIALTFAGVSLVATVLATPFLAVIAVVLLVIAIFVVLYTQVGFVRDGVNFLVKAIGEGFKWLWEVVLKPVIGWIWQRIKDLGDIFVWVWKNALKPVFEALGKAAGWVWNHILKPIFGFMVSYFKALAKFYSIIWNNILFPVFDMFGRIIWHLGKFIVKGVIDEMVWGWKHVLGPAFKWVWEHVLRPVFHALGDAFDWVAKKTKTAVEKIGELWSGLKKKLAAPINWVIKYVLNGGIIKAFNKVADFVGSKPIPTISQIGSGGGNSGTASGVNASPNNPKFASGGVLPGYTPGRDTHNFYSPTGGRLGLSGGEAIMRPEWTRAVGPGMVKHWNDLAKRVGVNGLRKAMLGGQAFAKGGVFWPTTGHITSSYRGHDGVDINGPGQDYGNPIFAYRSGRITYAGWGRGYGHAIFEQPNLGPPVVYGHGSSVYVKSGQSVKGGQLIGRVGSTGHSSGPHLHFGIPGGTFSQAMALLSGATNIQGNFSDSGGGGGILGKLLGNFVGKPVKWLISKVTDKFGDLTKKFGDNGWTGLAIDAVKKLAHGVGDKIGDMIGGVVGTSGGHIGAGAQAVREAVRGVAQSYGWGGGAQWSALDKLINGESGWNPNAHNPNSSAAGLFQKMTSLHGALEGTVAGQAKWGLNYIKSAYGSPAKAWSKWMSRSPHWYSDGGIVGDADGTPISNGGMLSGGGSIPDNGTMLYDDGGYLRPGITTVLNLTGKPEPVFTHDQFERGSGPGGSEFHYEPHFHDSDLSANDVANDLLFAVKSAKNSGKYGGGS